MKIHKNIAKGLLALAISIGMSSGICQAARTIDVFNSFPGTVGSPGNVNGWYMANWNGTPNATVSWAAGPTCDAGQSASSGSMEIQCPFTSSGENGSTALYGASGDYSAYTAFEFDVKVDPNSWIDGSGLACQIQPGLNWGTGPTLNIAPVATNNGWQHFSVPASAWPGAFAGLNQMEFQVQDYNSMPSNGTAIIYIDNIEFTAASPTYPNYTNITFQFDNANDVANIFDTWYGSANTVSWDNNPAHLDTLDPSSTGTLYINSTFGPGNNVVMMIPFDTNLTAGSYLPETNAADIIDARNYTDIELDVKWDSVNSTVALSDFNTAGDIAGFPIGAMVNTPLSNPTSDNSGDEFCGSSTNNGIPDAASNGWVHMILPITGATIEDSQTIGVWFKKYEDNPLISGTVAFWVDNITFDGGPSNSTPPSPTLTLAPVYPGLQLGFPGSGAQNNQYSRVSVSTLDSYSFVNVAPSTYTISLGYVPPTSLPNSAFIMFSLIGTSYEADYNDATLLKIAIGDVTGGSQVQFQCKTNQPNGNGSLYDASDPTWTTTSSTVGTWSFTISGNTNIYCLAPDGSHTNMPFPLGLQSADVQSWFGGQMYVYFGGEGGGSAGNGGRIVLDACSISGGAGSLSEDWVAEANTGDVIAPQGNLWTSTVSGVEWINCSDNGGALGLYYLSTNTPYFLQWTANGGAGFNVQDTATLGGAWNTDADLTSRDYLNGSYFETQVEQTDLPPSGNFFFRLELPH
jgi:hypothetical protein